MQYCDICGKLIEDEPIIPFGEKKLCEECWLEFDEKGIEENEKLDKQIIEILEHKEEYTREKLIETLLYLKENGIEKETLELEEFIKNYDANMGESESIVFSGGKAYKKSRGNVWIEYCKIACYIFWIWSTLSLMVIGGYVGNLTLSSNGGTNIFIGGVLGAIGGFIIGFIIIAVAMLFITMAENVATITDRATEILIKLGDQD